MIRIAIASTCAAAIAVGVGLVYVPAGLVVGGVLGIFGLYVDAYIRMGAGS